MGTHGACWCSWWSFALDRRMKVVLYCNARLRTSLSGARCQLPWYLNAWCIAVPGPTLRNIFYEGVRVAIKEDALYHLYCASLPASRDIAMMRVIHQQFWSRALGIASPCSS